MKTRQEQTGFSVVEVLLVLVAVALLGFTGWFVYHSSKVTNGTLNSANKAAQSSVVKSTSITSFDQCKKAADSIIQQTYPEQCVTKSGKTFIDTSQQNQNYLIIKEWGVKVPLTANISDAYYLIKPDLPNVAYLSLESLKGTICAADDITLGAISRFTATDMDTARDATVLSERPTAIKIGTYYYAFTIPQGSCNDGKGDATSTAGPQPFVDAFKHIQAE